MLFCYQNTSSQFVVEDAIFGRMDDIGDMFTKEVHEEFISNCISKAPGNFLPEYSYLYVLVAHGPSNKHVPPGEKRWSDILNPQQNTFLLKHRAFIVAWMLMTPEHPPNVHFIEYVDSRVPKFNVVDCMLKKYANELATLEDRSPTPGCFQIKPKCVIPKEITFGSRQYWKNFVRERYDVVDCEGLQQLLDNLRIAHIVHWHFLFTAFASEKAETITPSFHLNGLIMTS
jgi:hypothetical protein